MTRQRLPKGWEYHSNQSPLWIVTTRGTIAQAYLDEGIPAVLSIELNQCPPDTPHHNLHTDAALALIRNAGLDPIFEAAKRLAELIRHMKGTPEELVQLSAEGFKLAQLIDESEEPNGPQNAT
jgi:hypothetical protein